MDASLSALTNVSQAVDYSKQTARDFDSSPAGSKNRRKDHDSDSDTDFQERDESEEEPESEEGGENVAAHELDSDARQPRSARSSLASPGKLKQIRFVPWLKLISSIVAVFKRAQVPPMPPASLIPPPTLGMDGGSSPPARCAACENYHPSGSCPLKKAGVEYCPLCGIAHYGRGRICPHINSITQLQLMHEAIKHSPEPLELKELAKKKVTGLIGSIRQKRRLDAEAKAAKGAKESQALRQSSQHGTNLPTHQQAIANRHAIARLANGGEVGKENRMTGPQQPFGQY